MTPLASFLAGSLISLLLPVGLLIALAIWHFRSIMHIPETPPRTADVTALQTGPAEAEAVAPEGE